MRPSFAQYSFLFVLIILGSRFLYAAPPKLGDVRAQIEKKDLDQATTLLAKMYPQNLKSAIDVARLSQWMSVFLYDETVAIFEKAIQLSHEQDPKAQEEFLKALSKEPHNKKINQAYITFLLDSKRDQEAGDKIAELEQKYPYFKIFSIYKYYLQKNLKLEQKNCQTHFLLEGERDFCKTIVLRGAAEAKGALKTKWISFGKSIVYPEALFILWEMTSQKEYLNKYKTRCGANPSRASSLVKTFPGECTRWKEVAALLIPTEETPEE